MKKAMETSHGLRNVHPEQWEGSNLPTARFTESYRQTFEVCHHQKSDIVIAPIFIVTTRPGFDCS